MKTVILLIIASFTGYSSFAQKSRINEPKVKSADITVTYVCPVHRQVVSTHEGICAKCNSKLVVDRRGSKQVANGYTCSMHPQVASNEKGKCPICGTDLERKKDASGNTKAKL